MQILSYLMKYSMRENPALPVEYQQTRRIPRLKRGLSNHFNRQVVIEIVSIQILQNQGVYPDISLGSFAADDPQHNVQDNGKDYG